MPLDAIHRRQKDRRHALPGVRLCPSGGSGKEIKGADVVHLPFTCHSAGTRIWKRIMEAKLNELEAKMSLAEDLLEALNRTVFRQQQQIDRLQQDVRALRQQLQDAAPDEFAGTGNGEAAL